MRKAKKLVSLLLTLVMVMAMTISAFAEGNTYTITINGITGAHTYEAYQVFRGDLSTKTEGSATETILSNIEWGNGVDGAAILAELKTSNAFVGSNPFAADTVNSAEAVADVLTEFADDDANIRAFAAIAEKHLKNASGTAKVESGTTAKIGGLSAGYYLIKDSDGTQTGTGSAYTRFILKVVSDVDVKPKADTPEVEKKVQDTNDTDGTTTGWQDSADYDIGDKVPFQLTATLPENYGDYTLYKIEFQDTLSAGLTYNADAAVYVVNGNERVPVTGQFTITPTATQVGGTLTITCDDLTTITGVTASSKIVVEYTATLNDSAVIGSTGNPNTVKLIYSNDPNHDGSGTPPTGETPEDKVIVFTYQTIVNKTDQNENPLTGAEFTLEKKYNALPEGVNPETDADWTADKDENGTVTAYWKKIGVVKNTEGTTFTFSGLDDGDYRLHESKTPDGYNTIEDQYFTITATHETTAEDPKLTDLNGNVTTGTIEFTKVVSDGSLTTSVVNKSGSTLPSTGGIGTTMFYLIGGILVVGAGVVLVTRKRMGDEE